MQRKSLNNESLKSKTFTSDYSEHLIVRDSGKVVIVRNLIIDIRRGNDGDSNFLQKIGAANKIEELRFESVVFKNLGNINSASNLYFFDCTAEHNFIFNVSSPQLLSVESCDFAKVSVFCSYNYKTVIIKNSQIRELDLGAEKDEDGSIFLRVVALQILEKSIIHRIKGLPYLLSPQSDTVVLFSRDSSITKNPEMSYRQLRVVAEKFNDNVQSHILYTKTLELYAKKSDKDSYILLWLERLTNNYGQSFILPIVWMFVVNSAFLTFFLFTGTIGLSTIFDYLASVLNINPLNEFIDSKISASVGWAVALDSVRRLMLAALAYQAVTAARRFNFKK